MIIPRDVLLDCAREYNIPEAASLVERRVIHSGTPADHEIVDRVFELVCRPEALDLHSVARWRSYLTTMHFKFYEVWNHLRRAKPERLSAGFRGGSGGEVYVSTDAYTVMPIAAALYHLDSWNIQGDMIECGCFKGVSSAMLSWACKHLNRRMFIADSFNGLPAVTDAHEQYYKTGDYSGSLDEVRRMVNTFGCADVVSYVPGYFEESLPFLREHFALIFGDVDLKLSMESVLEWLMPRLHPDGAFFSDEVSAAAFDGSTIRADAVSVPAAIRDYFAKRGLAIHGRNMNLGVSVLAPRGQGAPFLSFERVNRLLLHTGRHRTLHAKKVA
jgi:hypothetical protein